MFNRLFSLKLEIRETGDYFQRVQLQLRKICPEENFLISTPPLRTETHTLHLGLGRCQRKFIPILSGITNLTLSHADLT